MSLYSKNMNKCSIYVQAPLRPENLNSASARQVTSSNQDDKDIYYPNKNISAVLKSFLDFGENISQQTNRASHLAAG